MIVNKEWYPDYTESIVEFSTLLGKVFVAVQLENDFIAVETVDGEIFVLGHTQDCCECVDVEDVVGDLKDLLNSPILLAEEATSDENPKDKYDDSFTWSFYKLATIKGYVDIRFYGTSNGFYSESVDLFRI